MKVEHIAIWVRDINRVCEFYQKYLGGTIHDSYHNPKKGFTSRFITFEDGARIEVMNRGDILDARNGDKVSPRYDEYYGWCHIAMTLGSKELVDSLTAQMAADGISVVGQPRTTGDGYYESVVLDPEGNRVELTA